MKYLLFTFLLAPSFFSYCQSSNTNAKDLSSTYFETVKIGNQTWSKTNLNVERFQNGDIIPHVKSRKAWILAGENRQPAWCYYKNKKKNGKKYGKLYNVYAVNDQRGLAPKGWHISTFSDWKDLGNYLGNDAATQMRSVSEWDEKDYIATNKSGFSALPGSYRSKDGNFMDLNIAMWWSTKYFDENSTRSFYVNNWFEYLFEQERENGSGLSVRLVKD